METKNTTPNKKSSLPKWLGLIVLIILLVAAAFVGGQLLNRSAGSQTGGANGPGLIVSGGGPPGGGPAGSGPVELKVTPAAELPTIQPETQGLFVRREDNSLFIGTGQISMMVSAEGDSSTNFDGPIVEVVVNGDTLVYKEVSLLPGPPTGGEIEQVIQQQVEEGTIEEIGEQSQITVWGRKVGDRIIADILLYSEPVIFNRPAP